MGAMGTTSLFDSFGMGALVGLAPRPRYLAWQMFTPFVVVLGGMALYLAALYLMVGQDPTVPVGHFLAESFVAVAPFAAFLATVWVLYLWSYVLAGASLSEAWIIAKAPGWFAGLLSRLHLSLPVSALVFCLIAASSSLVRLYSPYLPVRQAMGWRAGDSVQLE